MSQRQQGSGRCGDHKVLSSFYALHFVVFFLFFLSSAHLALLVKGV